MSAVLVGGARVTSAQIPAFPGAEGAGSTATGGRGQEVYHVTNLNQSGPGSFVDAVSQSNRIVVFDVSGVITLNTPDSASGRNDHFLRVGRSNITIAGQTAPGNGIVIQGTGTKFTGTNVVVRNISIRPGGTWNGQVRTMDGFWLQTQNSIFDHVSVAWASDEGISSSDAVANTTVQYSIVGEGLMDHSYGAIMGPDTPNTVISYHHNLISNNRSRNPRLGNETGAVNVADFRNNVIYNWSGNAGYSGGNQEGDGNFVGNYYIAGPSTQGSSRFRAFVGSGLPTGIYQSGNNIDPDQDGIFDGTNTGWAMFTGTYTQAPTPYAAPSVTTQTAADALDTVMDYSGAHWWNRTSTDARLVNGVRSAGTAGKLIYDPSEVGGWPIEAETHRPANWDTDQDGMPNAWEEQHGLDPNVANNSADFDNDGYTNIEEYINDAGAFPAPQAIVFNGATNTRYAQITNWDIMWQPSRYDTAVVNSGTVVVDAVGQHAGNVILAMNSTDNATLNITGGWLKVEDAPHGLSDGIVSIGDNNAATAELNLMGGKLVAKTLLKGDNGTFNFTGGILSAETVGFDLVNNGGAISPGNSPGVTHVMGDLALNSGILEIEIGGTGVGQFDQLVIDGETTLGGTLKVVPIDLGGGLYVPALGDTVMLLASQFGFGEEMFDNLDLPELDAGLNWLLSKNAQMLSLSVVNSAVLQGDYNNDGVVDAADYTIWRDNMGGASLPFNETASLGIVDQEDYAAWKANFGASSTKGSSSSAGVPEPNSFLLMILVLLSSGANRRHLTPSTRLR